jgi:CPA2 family monovalent cation:H+ antiporter-2
MSLPTIFAAGAVPAYLTDAVALVVAGAIIAYISFRLRLVPIVGFLLAGVLIGPHALGLVSNRELVDNAAEIGVILLLFTIGIEFSLEKLASIKRLIFVGGGLQVVLASLATMGLLAVFGVNWRAGLFTGFLVALSSTAIVLKVLGDRGETNSEQGQVGLGLLIFQDLAIIVMVLLVPVLSGSGGSAFGIVWALGKALAIIFLVLFFARRLMPKILEKVAETCSPELFLLTVIAICFGTAYLTSLAGVSLSLGAFLAGLLVSESRFSHHALGEIMPLQILFSATFFVSVGILLDLRFLVMNLPLVLAVITATLLIKIITTGLSVRALGYKLPVATASALMLAQIGEFSFVLERAGREVGLSPAGMDASGSQAFIAGTVMLMVLTPLLMQIGSRLAGRIEKKTTARAVAGMEAATLTELPPLSDHVIVAGYGQAARRLVHVLSGSGIPYIITTLSPGGANEAEAAGLTVLRGDYSKRNILELAGIERARMMVIADDDPAMTHRVVAVAKTLNPEMRIIVRTRYISDAHPLIEAGVDSAIAEEMESIARIFTEVMEHYEIPAEQIEANEKAIRSGGYAALLHQPKEGETPPVVCQISSGGLKQCLVAEQTENNEAVKRSSEKFSDAVKLKSPPVQSTVDTETTILFKPAVNKSVCSHLAQIRPVVPSARGCEECLALGDTWVHLRLCLTCGHVGCCDSSPNKHATAHFAKASHPLIKSLETGEEWGWCYQDQTYL